MWSFPFSFPLDYEYSVNSLKAGFSPPGKIIKCEKRINCLVAPACFQIPFFMSTVIFHLASPEVSTTRHSRVPLPDTTMTHLPMWWHHTGKWNCTPRCQLHCLSHDWLHCSKASDQTFLTHSKWKLSHCAGYEHFGQTGATALVTVSNNSEFWLLCVVVVPIHPHCGLLPELGFSKFYL